MDKNVRFLHTIQIDMHRTKRATMINALLLTFCTFWVYHSLGCLLPKCLHGTSLRLDKAYSLHLPLQLPPHSQISDYSNNIIINISIHGTCRMRATNSNPNREPDRKMEYIGKKLHNESNLLDDNFNGSHTMVNVNYNTFLLLSFFLSSLFFLSNTY